MIQIMLNLKRPYKEGWDVWRKQHCPEREQILVVAKEPFLIYELYASVLQTKDVWTFLSQLDLCLDKELQN